MPTNTTVKELKINKLTEAQYDAAVQGGTIGANELSFLTDMDVDSIQVSSLPTAAASEEDKIYQYVGSTTASYTNGYFYKCVSDGQTPATYSWQQINVQAGGAAQVNSDWDAVSGVAEQQTTCDTIHRIGRITGLWVPCDGCLHPAHQRPINSKCW